MSSESGRVRVLIVAGLTPVKMGGTGGGITEPTTLVNSEIRSRVEFIPVSSTLASIPPPGLARRAVAAVSRLFRFVALLPVADVALIYVADGLSLLEKGLMAVIARAYRRGVVLRFGSGRVPAQCAARPLLKRWVRLSLRMAHVNATQGRAWTEYFGQFPESRRNIIEIPNGVEMSSIPATERRRGQMAFVGWLHRDKGVYELLSALPKIRAAIPDARLVMAGGGWELEPLKALATESGLGAAVEFRGWIGPSDVRRLLRESEVFVFPSHFEGLPNAVLEALAEATPVVATRVGAVPDVVRDSETGYLVDVEDVEQLAEKVIAVLQTPERARRMGEQGRALILDRYDISQVWSRFADVLWRAGVAAGRVGTQSVRDTEAETNVRMNGE